MFENSGKKVKVLAWIFFCLACIGSLVGGIIMWHNARDYGFLLFLAFACGGFLSAWISSVVLYAIGEAADKSDLEKKIDDLAQRLQGTTEQSNSSVPASTNNRKPDSESMHVVCPDCGAKNDVARVFCKECGSRLS